MHPMQYLQPMQPMQPMQQVHPWINPQNSVWYCFCYCSRCYPALNPETLGNLTATVPCFRQPGPTGNWQNELNVARQRMAHPPSQVPAVPAVLSPLPSHSCMLTPRAPSGQLRPVGSQGSRPAPVSEVPPMPRPLGITGTTMQDRNDPHFWRTQLDTSFSVASTVSRTPLSPSPVKVESSDVPRLAAATSPAVTTRAVQTVITATQEATAPTSDTAVPLGIAFPVDEPRGPTYPQLDFKVKTELLKSELSRLKMSDDVVDPYEGLRLTPIDEQPFKAIASIARKAQQSLESIKLQVSAQSSQSARPV